MWGLNPAVYGAIALLAQAKMPQ